MKCLILVLACATASYAQLWGPMIGGGGGYARGGAYGGNRYAGGANGMLNSGYGASGMGGYHNIGGHHHSATSVNRVDNTGYHNIGGGQGYQNGGYLGNGYNNYANGAGEFGRDFGMGGGGGII